MVTWHTEDTFDVVLISHADLNMRFTTEACGRVERFALGKCGPDSVKGRSTGLFAGLVQVIDDHAVEFAVEKVFAA